MTEQISSNTPRFVPLSFASQGYTENVLYYKADASLDAIYECASARLKAAIKLFEELLESKTVSNEGISAVAVVSTILLNDAYSLYEELSPIAQVLRKQED